MLMRARTGLLSFFAWVMLQLQLSNKQDTLEIMHRHYASQGLRGKLPQCIDPRQQGRPAAWSFPSSALGSVRFGISF